MIEPAVYAGRLMAEGCERLRFAPLGSAGRRVWTASGTVNARLAGHLAAISAGARRTVRSPLAHNDGSWHHVVASIGPAGMRLYADGTLVASDTTITVADSSAGYIRIGGTNLSTWPNRPTNDYLTGTLDGTALYATQLSDQTVAWHYHANH